MKILFLDIDGVINSVRSASALGGYPYSSDTETWNRFDLVAVSLIKKLCKDTDTKIVLSSSWRHYKGWELLNPILELDIIDKTPTLSLSGGRRGQEIKMWLDQHPEVTKYAIVDDDNDMLKEQEPFFVRTSNLEGLSYTNYFNLVEILK